MRRSPIHPLARSPHGRAPGRYRHTALLAWLLALLLAGPAAGAVRDSREIGQHEVITVAPDEPGAAVPLLIALHGCDQDAAAFLESTGLDALVDAEGIALALPTATAGRDNPLGCWRWWDPRNQRRDGPAPRGITAIIDAMTVPVDRQRVYVLGLSSGGAMAAILATVYPDIFAAAGIHAGVGFAAAGNAACAVKNLDDAPQRVEARGELAYLHQARHRIVPTMIIHGEDDATVDPRHARGLVRELAQRNDFIDDGDGGNDSFDAAADATVDAPGPCRAGRDGAPCHPHELERYTGAGGRALLQRVMVAQLGHAWSGGREGHPYADPAGPDAGAMFWQFFKRHRLDPATLTPAPARHCRQWWGPPWWHFLWARTMSFSEYACDMSPWRVAWRHRIEGVAGPGRCP